MGDWEDLGFGGLGYSGGIDLGFGGLGYSGGIGLVWEDLGLMIRYSEKSSVLAVLKQAWGLGSFRRSSGAQTL